MMVISHRAGLTHQFLVFSHAAPLYTVQRCPAEEMMCLDKSGSHAAHAGSPHWGLEEGGLSCMCTGVVSVTLARALESVE